MAFFTRLFTGQKISNERKNINRVNKQRERDGLNNFKEYQIEFPYLNYGKISQKISQQIPITDLIPSDTKDSTYMHFKYKDISIVIITEKTSTRHNLPKLNITIEALQRQAHVACTRIKGNRRRAIEGLKDRKIKKDAQGKNILSRPGDGKKFLALIVNYFSEVIEHFKLNSPQIEDYDLQYDWYGDLSEWWTRNRVLPEKQGPCVEEEFKNLNMCVRLDDGTYLIRSMLFAKWAKDCLIRNGLLIEPSSKRIRVSKLNQEMRRLLLEAENDDEAEAEVKSTSASLVNKNIDDIPLNKNLYCFCKNKTRQRGGRKRKLRKRKTKNKRKKRKSKKTRKKYNRY